MEEKKDKYQESIEDEPVVPEEELPLDSQLNKETEQKALASEKAEEVLSSPEKLDSQEKLLEGVIEKEESKLVEEKEPVEIAKPKSSTDGLSSTVPTEDDQALRSKKVEEIKKLSKEEQIKALCSLAFEKDIDFAAEIAKGLNDAYVLDEFHDSLDKLSLIEKGKLKKI